MKKNKKLTFSVLMSVYNKDNPEHLKLALESIYEKQTKKPDEIVVVIDGPITPELQKILKNFRRNKEKIVKYLPQKENRGLGEALRIGSEKCTCDYIFRMDSDDISAPKRFEMQSKYINNHPEVDVLGGNIEEFLINPNEANKRIRACPTKMEDIVKMSKRRNPMNHMTVCIRRKALIDGGGYLSLKYLEDYYLWIRLIIKGKKLSNINETLVYARVGNGFEKRRGAKEQVRGWRKLQDEMLKAGMITKMEAIQNMAYIRIFINTPAQVKKIVYRNFLRK